MVWVLKNAYEGKRLELQCTLTQCLEDLDYADNLCLLTHQLADMKVKGERLQETGGQVRARNQHAENKGDANWHEATRIIVTLWGSC